MSAPAENAERLLRRIEWTSLRRLDGLLQGDYRTLMRGSGLDLADLREYQYQDDVRRIDWNATARLDVPHVRDYLETRDLAAWFVVDLSASMDFGSGTVSKRDRALGFIALLGRLLMRHGNRFGAVMGDGRLQRLLPARGGRRHLLQLLTWAAPNRVVEPQPEEGLPVGGTDLAQLLARAGSLIRRRSLVFVLSDFIAEPGWEHALTRLSLRHEVIAIRLLDPMEQALPDLGLVPMRDAETAEWLMVDTHDAELRARYERIAQAREEALLESLARAGVDTLALTTEDDLAMAVLDFIRQRKLRSRMNAGAASAVRAAATAGGARALSMA